MKRSYTLKNAIRFNPTGKKYNAIASVASVKEIRQHKEYFEFDFEKLAKEGVIYKICKERDDDMILGLVAVKQSKGVLDCANMETNKINKTPICLHDGIGRSIIALCCKISFDMGTDGFITFEAKNRLMPYYRRFGAQHLNGLRMFIDTENAKKLVDLYF
ncbi:hypothetical protein [Ferruginibacter profundus]